MRFLLTTALFSLASLPLAVFAQIPSTSLSGQYFTTPHILDITIIGDKYTNMGKFRQDTEKFKSALLTHEPFKSRAQEIAFHAIENTSDLGCAGTQGFQDGSAQCNDAVLDNILENKAVPTDKLLVLVDGVDWGAASGYAIAGNIGADFEKLAIHEFAHIFGLMDEYVHQGSGVGYGAESCQANCCFSLACVDWKDIPGAACIPGCTYGNGYRSSEDSIMRNYATGGSFNVVSRRILDRMISRYTNKIAPQVFLTSPEGSLPVKGTIYPEARAVFSETSGIYKIEIYLDDKLFHSVNLGGFFAPAGTTEWRLQNKALDTTNFFSGSRHVLYAKVYDHAGNIATSPSITITVDNAPPSISILEPRDGDVIDGFFPIKLSVLDDSRLIWFGLNVDNVQIASAEPGKSGLVLNTAMFPRGSKQRIHVRAQDELLHIGMSTVITVTIANPLNVHPSLSATSTQSATPFVISNIHISKEFNPGQITVTWDTNKGGTSDMELLAGLCWGGVPCKIPSADPVLMTHHSVTFSGSAPSTIYTLRVKSQDAAGNLAFLDHTFTTAYSPASEFHPASELDSPRPSTQKFYRTLQQGIRGDEVRALQELLARSPDIYPEGLTTGYFGPLTEAAVKRFQTKYGIVSAGDPTTTGYGLVGPRTRAKLNELFR